MVISTDTIAILDPHKRFISEDYDSDLSNFLSHSGHASCFDGIFDLKQSTSHYGATLFRFPLRKSNSQSEIVKGEYSPDRVKKFLYSSFIHEAPVIMLFLKYVQEISLFDNEELVYKVSIDSSQVRAIERERGALLQLAQHASLSCSLRVYTMSILTDDRRASRDHSCDPQSQYHWLVLNMIGSSNREIMKMSREQNTIPWVGIAAPLPHKTSISLSLKSCNTDDIGKCITELRKELVHKTLTLPWCDSARGHLDGQLFCFLPLPRSTNLPVNIHGYFSVSDNRRDIDWPASDNRSPKALWNQALVEAHIAPLYSILLALRASLLRYTNTPLPQEDGDITDPYAAWPLISKVRLHPVWNGLVSPTMRGIAHLPILWTAANGGQWVCMKDAIFLPSRHPFPIPATVIELLIRVNIPLVSLPLQIRETLVECGMGDIFNARTINSAFVRQLLKELHQLSFNTKEGVEDVLEYILHDIDHNNCTELVGLQLLPVDEMKLKTVCFKEKINGNDDCLYVVDRNEEALEFLTNINSFLVRRDLRASIFLKLRHLARNSNLQLRSFTANAIISHLIPLSIRLWFPKLGNKAVIQWRPGHAGEPPQEWISCVWNWLNRNCDSLSELEGLPLIPLITIDKHYDSINLLRMPRSNTGSYFFNKESDIDEVNLADLLVKMNATVVKYNSFIFSHQSIKEYFHKINIQTVLQHVNKIGIQTVSSLKDQEKAILRSAIASFYKSRGVSFAELIKTLPIFEAGVGANPKKLVSINQGYVLPHPRIEFEGNLTYPPNFFSNTDYSVCALLNNLGCPVLGWEDLLITFIIPFAMHQCQSSSHRWCNGDELLVSTLNRTGNSAVLTKLRETAFIRTEANIKVFKRPEELFDVSDEQFTKLFDAQADPVFPHKHYYDKRVAEKLQIIGLVTWKKLVRDNIRLVSLFKDRACKVSNMSNQSVAIARSRSYSIIELIASVPKHSHSIMTELSVIPFLAVETLHPPYYPSSLYWAGADKRQNAFETPSNLFSFDTNPHLVGAVAPLLASDYSNLNMNSVRPFLKSVCVAGVLRQFNILVNYVKSRLYHEGESEKITVCVRDIYEYLNRNIDSVSQHSLPPEWIWWQNEENQYSFMKSASFVWQSSISLSPFIHTLTDNRHLASYKDLFIKSGGVRQSLTSVDIAGVLFNIASSSSQLNDKYLNMVITIISYLKQESFTGNIYLPTTECQLLPAKDCTYDDREWIRRRVGAGISKFKFVHERIPSVTAKYFGVEPLSKKVAPSSKLKLTYTKAGQSERITRRIGGIVSDYSGNIDVFKELIQNADDAGASEVKLLLDWRHHGKSTVIVEEMSQWQGPALIAYNNATFSDQDFKNICELAAESKMKDPMKTGRFGVGFCSCYSITDVPSFVSRHSLTIFDPHTKYLGERASHSEPGIRINLVENREDLEIYKDQFQPFDGLFGCHIFQLTGDGFSGTIFRFPLRMNSFPMSEMCNEHYDEYRINSLIQELRKEADKILIFLKNVCSFEFYVIHESATSPVDMKLQFKVRKESKEHGGRLQLLKDPRYCQNPFCSMVTVSVHDDSCISESQLVVSTALSKIPIANSKPGLLPLAELAIPLSPNSFCPVKLENTGNLFCFLPLPLKSYVPFHVNGFFDIGKDRRGLKEAEQSQEYQWNEGLIKTVLPFALESALAKLAKCLKNLKGDEDRKQYYSLWPGDYSESDSRRNWLSGVLSASATNVLINSNEKLLWSEAKGGMWVTPKESYLFIDSIPKEIENEAVNLIKFEGYPVIECPAHIEALLRAALTGINHVLSYQWFFNNVFLPNICSISELIRDNQIMFVLQKLKEEKYSQFRKYTWVDSALRGTPCIVISGSNRLSRPCDLIDASCEPVAQMYDESEGRFPNKKFSKVNDILVSLGMISEKLPLEMLAERARTISVIEKEDKEKANKRMLSLLMYINYEENRNVESRYYGLASEAAKKRTERTKALNDIPCLLSASKPDIISVPWACKTERFISPSKLYSPDDSPLLFASVPLLHIPSDSNIEVERMAAYLGIDKNKPTLGIVLDHLCELIQHFTHTAPDEATLEYIKKERVFHRIYNFLQREINHDKDTIIQRLQNKQCIWQKGRLLYPKQVVCHWESKECYPYISPLSDDNLHCKELFLALRVQDEANFHYLLSLLAQINTDYPQTPLSKELLDLTVTIANKLYQLISCTDNVNYDDILLPNNECILCPVSKLSCDSFFGIEWVSQLSVYQEFVDSGGRPTHPDIPKEHAFKLGAHPLMDAIMKHIEDEKFLDDTDFGQTEDLVDRLNGILKKYPADTSIFREYIQNADDAKATEIVFVLDHRRDHPDKRLLTEGKRWASLQQSPALCIYNNRQFSESDIKGICQLGRGGKGDTADTIGRFGIGFNVSYHLTDCPTFVSFDSQGHPKDLCVFDPLRRYCNRKHGKPGRRWKVSQMQKDQFPDQFKPFLVEEIESMKVMADCFEDISSGFVVFRLPLLRYKPLHHPFDAKWLKEGGAHDLYQVEKLIRDFRYASNDMLLFLNNIKNISVFEIKGDGKCVHHFSSSATITKEDKGKTVKFGSTIIEMEVTHQVIRSNKDEETVTNWIVSKRSGFYQSSTSSFSDLCKKASERGLEPYGGVATPLVTLNVGNLFCFLPMKISSCLPVHLNAHFLVDDSRRHLESLPGLESWNSSIAEHLLLPAYVDLLLEARKKVDGSQKTIQWFYNLFPISSQTSEASQLKLNELLYCKLLQVDCPVLLDARFLKKGETTWLSIKTGQFCIDHVAIGENFIKMAKKLEPVFVSLDMPITCAPDGVFRSLVRVASSYASIGLLTPNKVLSQLKQIDPEDYEDTLKENCETLLAFCLQHCPSNEVHGCLKGVPLLLTLAGTLDSSGKIFESKFSDLLPHHKEWFVSLSLEGTQIGKILREGGVIVQLSLHYVTKSIKLEKVNGPKKLSANDIQLVKLLWVYLININSPIIMPADTCILNEFNHMPILPAKSGLFYPPVLGKCLFHHDEVNSNEHVEKAMVKLGFEILNFTNVDQNYVPFFVRSTVSSFSSWSDIMKCFKLRPPNLTVCFSPDEVSHLISVLCQADEIDDSISALLKKLPLFQTVDKTFITVSSATEFYIKPLFVPNEGIITIQRAINQVVLANPGAQADALYKKIFKENYESAQAGGVTGFYLKFLIPHFSLLSDSELEIHLRFIKHKYSTYYSSTPSLIVTMEKEWELVIALLKETPLIKRQQDGSGGNRQLVSKFCDPEIKFNTVFQEAILPPLKWRGQEWLPFLRTLGLQSKISTTLWLDKAKKVSKEVEKLDKRVEPAENLVEKSNTLINSLEKIITELNSLLCYNEQVPSQQIDLPRDMANFLTEASKIKFLYSPEPCKLVTHIETIANISPVEHQYFLSFHEAVFNKSSNMACLVRSVLPPSCKFLERCRWNICNRLSIREPINLKAVVKNLIAISKALSTVKAFIPSTEMQRAIRKVKEVIENHYKFIESHLDDKIIQELMDEPCILLTTSSHAYQLVKPHQLVMDLPEQSFLHPFCYGTPTELLKYSKLLTALGVKKQLDPLRYISILAAIKKELGQTKLHEDKHFENVCNSAYKALIKSLRSLQEPPIFSKDVIIYLPSSDGQDLVPSTELVHNDVPWVATRLQNSKQLLKYKFIHTPPPDERGQTTPPPSLRVKLLGSLAVEKLSSFTTDRLNKCNDQELFENKKHNNNCKAVEVLEETLRSHDFTKGIGRLYWHHHQKNPRKDAQFCIQLRSLSQCEVRCVKEISTLIYLEGREVRNTEDSSRLCYFVVNDQQQQRQQQNQAQKKVRLYIAHKGSMYEDKLFEELAKEIGHFLIQGIGDAINIKHMLRCYPNQISMTLDKLKISPFDMQSASDTIDSSVSDQVIGSHIDNPAFLKEELIIMCNYDKDEKVIYHYLENGEECYVFARIVEYNRRIHAHLNDMCIKVIIGKTEKGDEIIKKASLFQIYKLLNISQKKYLETRSSSAYTSPVVAAFVPLDEEKLEKWLRDTLVYNGEHSCCSDKQLSLRLTGHLHFVLVVNNKGPELFVQASKRILDIISEEETTSGTARQAVEDLVSKLESLSIEDDSIIGEPQTPPLYATVPTEFPYKQDSSRRHSSSFHRRQLFPQSPNVPKPSLPSTASAQSAIPLYRINPPGSSGTSGRGYGIGGGGGGSVGGYIGLGNNPFAARALFPEAKAATPPQPSTDNEKAKIWLQQCKADYLAAINIWTNKGSLLDNQVNLHYF